MALCHELCTLLATYPLCGSALTDTMDNLVEKCPFKLKKLPVFVASIIDNLTWAAYSQWLSQVVMTGDQRKTHKYIKSNIKKGERENIQNFHRRIPHSF